MLQTALIIPKHRAAFEIGKIPIYKPGPEQLLVKTHAAALSPADWKVQTSGQYLAEFPAVLGFDRAGEVVEIGDGIVGFEKGDRVVAPSRFIENPYQGFQQYGIVDANVTSKIPLNISYDEAATLPAALSTAISGFFAEFPHGAGFPLSLITEDRVGLRNGQYVIILGGASSVGQFAIQTAKLAGFSEIITTASLKNEALLRSHGATHVLDRSFDASALIETITAITSDHPPRLVFDSIGIAETEKLGIAVAAHWHSQTGQECSFVTVNPEPSEGASAQNNVGVSNIFGASNTAWNLEPYHTVFHDKLYEWLESGIIKPLKFEIVDGGLAAIPEALRRHGEGEISGLKLVVHPQDQL